MIKKLTVVKKLLLAVVFCSFSVITSAQKIGIFEAAIEFNAGGTNKWYSYEGTAISSTQFNGANLGSFAANSQSLKIIGLELQIYEEPGGNFCGGTVNYRIYKTGDTPGSFLQEALPFRENCSGSSFPTGDPCSAHDQKWNKLDYNIDLTKRCPGDYTLELFLEYTGSETSTTACDLTRKLDNSGSNFKASFTITGTPTPTPAIKFYSQSNCGSKYGVYQISNYDSNASYAFTPSGPQFSANQTSSLGPGMLVVPEGTYTVTATVNGCTSSASTSFTVNPQPTPPPAPVMTLIAQPTCDPAAQGRGVYEISNFDPNAKYTITPSQSIGYANNNKWIGVPTGTYTITATVNGCISSTSTFTVGPKPANCP
ncbi:hypothetical protein [Chryseobacterium shandongense]|uniref:hypothetical protein n=1 Tax=Chryseobacterium shandongense TaxID=1493872 RepID=UPI000F500D4A|nr:hypothetical protein [Chryseobacterium shandongense]AZA58287.1 hypothetical protein EG350_14300 [Chryseobacterium shandongense]